MIETLRIVKFVLSTFGLGWSLGMLKVYWHLLRTASQRTRATWVPGSMVSVTMGISLLLVAILWSQVTHFHDRITAPSVITYFGVIALDIGLVYMQRGISDRENERSEESL